MSITDGKAFGITVGLDLAICVFILFFFGLFRRSRVAYKFYSPARFDKHRRRRPKELPRSLFGWVLEMYRYSQAELVAVAGFDAAMFMRIMAFGAELFAFLTIWCLLVVLPTNMSGDQVEYLIGKNAVPTSEFTYWISPPPPPSPPGQDPPASGPPPVIRAPDFYDSAVPPAPAGLTWWRYRSDVPPLPDPRNYFNDSFYDRFGWRYDSSYSANEYTFSNLDITSMTNIRNGDPRLWVHLLSTWVISIYLWKLLWRYNREAVALRIQFLNSNDRRAESCTALVRDVPGIYYGSVPDRIERTVLRFLPRFVKRRIVEYAGKALEVTSKGVDVTIGLAQTVLPDSAVPTPPDRGPPTPLRTPELDAPNNGQVNDNRGYPVELGPGEAAPGMIPTELDAEAAARCKLASGCSTQQMVQDEFDDMFDGKVARVHMAFDTRELDTLVSEYEQTRLKLEDLLDDYISQDRRHRKIKRQRITIIGARYGTWGLHRYGTKPVKVDALQFYVDRLQALLNQIKATQRQILPPNERVMPAAFVTFKERRCQVTTATTIIHHDRRYWTTDVAPGPDEIVWKNLGWRKWERKLRFALIWGVFFLIVWLYIPIVTSIQALLQVDKLTNLPIIKELKHSPLTASVVTSLLPSLVLRVFLAVLPYLLAYLNEMQGMVSLSDIQFGVVTKYFAFQVLTVFLTSLIAGTILSQIMQFVQNPSTIVRSLGAAAPQTATFFMLYLLFTGLVAKPLQFLRLPGLILLHIRTALAGTERAKRRLWIDQYLDYGWEIPDSSIAVLLGLVYCVIQPLMAVIALLYFLVNSALYKYQLVFVHQPRFESGGKVWEQVFNQVMFAGLVFQLVMLGLMGLKGVLWQSLLLLPLPILTVALWNSAIDLFAEPQRILSLRAATDLDKHDRQSAQDDESSDGREPYLHPAFQINEAELEALLAEAQRVEGVLSTPDYVPGLLDQVASETEGDAEQGSRMSMRTSSTGEQLNEQLLPPGQQTS